jgi:streptogramin lyase
MRTSPVLFGTSAVILLLTLSASRSEALTLAPGDLVVVDQVADVVVRVDPSSGAQTLISNAGGGFDVAVAPNGTIWMSQGNSLVRVDPDSGIQTVVASDIDLSGGQVTGISIAPSGDIIVGTFGAGSSVTSVDPVTGNTTLLSNTGNLNGVVVNAAGDIFVAPELGDQILRLDSTGTLQQTYDLIGPPGQDFGRPEDIAFAPDGDLIVLDGIRDVFLKLDFTSGSQTIIDPLVFSSFPFGIAVEAGGDFVFPGFETSSGEAALWRLDPVTQIATLITSGGLLSDGNGLRSVAVVPIPEPGTAVLLLLGLTLTARIPRHSRSLP